MSELNARESLCWNCKHGICVHENEEQKVYHKGMSLPTDENPFEIDEGPEFQEQSEPDEIIEHDIEQARVKAICFWRPQNSASDHPIVVATVKQCNRFQKQLD